MGVMKFLVARRDWLASDVPKRAYMAGADEIPWRSRAQWTEGGFELERLEHDSGNVFVPGTIPGHGEVVLSTASLMERPQPYWLEIELARGTVHRLRNQMAAFDLLGIETADAAARAAERARHDLAWAVTHQSEPAAAADKALSAITSALDAIRLLCESYCSAVLDARRQQNGRLHSLLGVNLGPMRPSATLSKHLKAAITTSLVPLCWREIEAHEGRRDWAKCDEQIDWSRSMGLKVCGGPLVALDRQSLPDWMYLWGQEDEDSLRSCVAEHIQAVVSRYRGKVQLWLASAGLNRASELLPDEEARLRLAVLSIEAIRRLDARAPVVISVDQPWGDFMSREDCELSPLHFVDALVRADLGLSGIALEINWAYAEGGTEPRDPLEIGRQVERFGSLGLPLLVMLTAPSANSADPRAARRSAVLPYQGVGEITAETQRAWVERVVPLLLSRPIVQGILWNQLADSHPHRFPHGGLLDDQERPKPIVGLLENLRRQHLA